METWAVINGILWHYYDHDSNALSSGLKFVAGNREKSRERVNELSAAVLLSWLSFCLRFQLACTPERCVCCALLAILWPSGSRPLVSSTQKSVRRSLPGITLIKHSMAATPSQSWISSDIWAAWGRGRGRNGRKQRTNATLQPFMLTDWWGTWFF